MEEGLTEALEGDIIERVIEPSAWISLIIILFESNGDIWIFVDMCRVSEAMLRESYLVPTFDTFMTRLRNAKYFSRLDLKKAYHRIKLVKKSCPITTFITHRGMFRYKRLMFGANSAPEIFQRVFEGILATCRDCINYLHSGDKLFIWYGGA